MKMLTKSELLLVIILGLDHVTASKFVACKNDHKVANGHVDFAQNETTFNQSVPVTCKAGYEVSGDPYITCLGNGTWSNDTTCIKTACKNDHNVANGQVDFAQNETTFNQSVPVTCKAGYEVSGDPYITCLGNGTWSNDTTCIKTDSAKTKTVYILLIVAGLIFLVAVITCVVVLLCFKRSKKVSLTDDIEGPDLDVLDMEVKV